MVAIHHLADYGGAYAGSFVPMLAATAQAATARGWRTTVWLSDSAREREWLPGLQGHAEVRWLEGGRGPIGSVSPTLRALAPRTKGPEPVVLHTHFSSYDIAAALMRLGRPRAAVFWHEHTRPPDDAKTRVRNTARYAVLGPLVSGMLCVSPEIRDLLRQRHAPAGRLVDFPNAIDLARFPATTPERRAEARRALGIADTDHVVLHFGWDWHRKGGDLMVAASGIQDEADMLWLTVGAPEGSAGVADGGRVRILPPANDVGALYAAADVFLSCSRGEGMPYAVLEALACGLPVVGTDLPGQTPLLTGLPSAEVVAEDPAAIAAAVGRLAALTPAARAEHARRARERVAGGFSLETWAQRLLALYERALPA